MRRSAAVRAIGLIDRLKRAGVVDPQLDSRYAGVALTGMVDRFAYVWFILEEDFEEASSELVGLAIAAVVLIITFGSFIAAGMPLLNAIIGVGVTMSTITIASRFIDMSEDSSILAMMLGIALAIDYSLFIASRYRHELSTGRDGEEAAGRAIGTAGNAVVFAGLTVMIALVGLTVVGLPLVTEMGV
jgi:RND superfamily putative drug exporter